MDDATARHALEAAAQHADRAGVPAPFVWSGAQWTTPGGEWRDWPLVRRGMGEWLRGLAAGLDTPESGDKRREQLHSAMRDHRFAAFHATDPEDKRWHTDMADKLTQELEAIPTPVGIALATVARIRDVASEIESASDARATQLLSLASQFDAFRAPLSDPTTWVKRLGSAPHNAHVRTKAVWDAFCTAEPVLARNLGATTGKRALFAAMDKRFGTRRKLAGYEGWRGVALPVSEIEPAPRG
ncbi:hypothetical protein ACWCPS_29405 [Streptomyces mauvecolor]